MYRKILLAYDSSDGAKTALKQALALAKGLRAEVAALWVRSSLPHYPETVSEIAEEQEAANAYYRRIASYVQAQAAAEGVDIRVLSRPGGVAQTILQVAEEESFDLIVLGSRGHSGAWGHLLGHTADRVSDHARCSVLIAKDGS